MSDPYIVQNVSVGIAGPTPRPAVVESATGRRVHTYRKGQQRLAEAMADTLNHDAADAKQLRKYGGDDA